MAKQLYYVIEKELQNVGENEETNGWKTITIYEIIDNKLKLFEEIQSKNEDNSVTEIQNYLDENGFGDDDIELIQL